MSTDLTPEKRAELRALAEAATPGPWAFDEQAGRFVAAPVLDGDLVRQRCGFVDADEIEDIEYIAAANPAVILALLAERDRLQARLDAVQALHHRETRWGCAAYSLDSDEYAARKAENDENAASWALDHLAPFDVCAECYRVEQSIEQGDDRSVLEGLWPCPTVRTAEGGES